MRPYRRAAVTTLQTVLLLFYMQWQSLNAAETVGCLYDSLNRITNITYSTGGSISYAYDKAGNRVALSSIANTTGAGIQRLVD